MNINDLVTQYVEFRRTLGERCKSNEDVLRSFCRAVGPRTRLARIREKHATEFLNGSGPITNARLAFLDLPNHRDHVLDRAVVATQGGQAVPNSKLFIRQQVLAEARLDRVEADPIIGNPAEVTGVHEARVQDGDYLKGEQCRARDDPGSPSPAPRGLR